ncbi:MAG: OmpH family outer membrane protein [Pseudomonadota bacterium]
MRGWLLALLLWPGLLAAQNADRVPQSQILTIDSSQLFPGTVLGQSILQALAEERATFAAESQEIAAELRTEELALTEQRQTLPREEFAALAAEFDIRVQAARDERDAGEAALLAQREQQEIAFLRRVRPILGQIMDEASAVVLIEADTVFLRDGAIDVTAIAIERINDATRPVPPREGNAPASSGGPSPEAGAAVETPQVVEPETDAGSDDTSVAPGAD